MDATGDRALTGPLTVHGIETYKRLHFELDATGAPLFSGLLVNEQPAPVALAGTYFVGGLRRQEDPDQTALAEELAAFRRMTRGAAFAMYVRDVFDLGNGDTGLVGYLLGTAAVGNTACLYERTGGYQLSEPVPVKSLVYERMEQSTLASADQLLPCGVVIGGRYKPQKIRGEILIEWSKMM